MDIISRLQECAPGNGFGYAEVRRYLGDTSVSRAQVVDTVTHQVYGDVGEGENVDVTIHVLRDDQIGLSGCYTYQPVLVRIREC